MRVLITGASSGIGEKMAERFAEKGYDLLLVARRENLLKDIKYRIENATGVNVDYMAYDITENPYAVYEYCKDNRYRISVLVNNAGFGDYGKFIDGDIDKFKKMIDLNNKALVELTYYFIKDMKDDHYGHIINTGSVASFMPGPYMAVYYATKAFVMSFSMALREELKKDGIKVSVLCPAPTKSEFWETANGETSFVYKNIFARTTDNAADTAMKMFDENKAYAIDGLPYKIAIAFVRHMPIEMCTRVMGFVQSKTKKKRG
ncbi:MAG: SDR family oxidoreductase [Erysipelotrichaceae bacterium]|nr:SDR family oxidoreductase [Erysipelotrichaceae bacterium]